MANKPFIPKINPKTGLKQIGKSGSKISKGSQKIYDNYFAARGKNFSMVKRFLGAWLGLMTLALGLLVWQQGELGGYYLSDQPDSGGTYVEGVLGEISSLNPIFTESEAASAAAKLIFSGLTKYNGRAEIELDLAESYSVNADLTEYIFKIRPDAKWHDGAPVTADDVVFTVQAIQNPTSRSPLASSWRGVEVKAVDEKTVMFSLPSPYAPFLNLLDVGLLPNHVLGQAGAAALRIHEFNQKPIGSGPFRFEQFLPATSEVHTRANPEYYTGKPHLNRFLVKGYKNYEELLSAYRGRAITSVGGFDVARYEEFSKASKEAIRQYPVGSQTLAFFNLRKPLFADASVRQALTSATDLHELVLMLEQKVTMARSPLIASQLGYDSSILQPGFDADRARQILDDAGWKLGADGIRIKDGVALSFELVTQSNGIYPKVAGVLQKQWQSIGADITVKTAELVELEQTHLIPRNFDVLVFPIAIGADPDVYAFWHSSQIHSPGLNLSGYNSVTADTALADGRTRADPKVREAKYKAFLSAWVQDVPAVALFQNHYLYVSNSINNLKIERLAEPDARFHNVSNWAAKFKTGLRRLVE